jgi:hypothetical protein
MAAAVGLDATGVDAAPTALAAARKKADERGLSVRFLEWDALELASLGEQFDTVLDCGLFHVFEDEDRPRFVDGLRASLPVGGRYYMLCFSHREPGDWGPRRIREEEIRAAFADGGRWKRSNLPGSRSQSSREPHTRGGHRSFAADQLIDPRVTDRPRVSWAICVLRRPGREPGRLKAPVTSVAWPGGQG